MHSFLLIGQSNMAGRGAISQVCEIDRRGIYLMRNGYWQHFYRPINPDGQGSGVSLGESFAESYVKKHGVDVGLVCCAVGGTRLLQWKKGSPLFDNAVFQAKLAMRSSDFAGILWHQGECDTAKDRCEVYEEEFDTFVKDFRQALGVGSVPFITGALGDFLVNHEPDPAMKNYNLINTAIQNVVKKNENMGYAVAHGLTANPDNLHFNAQSLYTFGKRYFDELERVTGK